MRTRLLGFGALLVAASVAVIGAQQHRQDSHSTGTHATRGHQFQHQMCESHHPAGASLFG